MGGFDAFSFFSCLTSPPMTHTPFSLFANGTIEDNRFTLCTSCGEEFVVGFARIPRR